MASEWELGMGFGIGMGIGGASVAPSLSAASVHAPNYAVAGIPTPAYLYGLPSTDTLRVDDLLDFSNHEVLSGSSAAAADNHVINYQAAETSSVTGSRPFAGESGSHVGSFADDIYIPAEEAAELEWLSKFVEDSFSDVPYPASSAAIYLPTNAQIRVDPTTVVPGRGARSKRSRAASTNFTPNLVPNQSSSSSSTSSSSSSDIPPPPTHISCGGGGGGRRKGVSVGGGGGESMNGAGVDGGVRRCTHCASEKTPQWRTGPLGPKTLCNACGVRYKSGRLVPEYRPAASPTFLLTQHSNSHRKVMELRRQKEQLHLLRHENAAVAVGGSASREPEIIYHN